MGYTHYWTQRRNFTAAEWATVTEDVQAILKEAQHNQGIALANGHGDGGTSPVFKKSFIAFNGVGDDGHETMLINRLIPKKGKYPGDKNPAWDFCKTAEKPYDTAVTAVLCYLATITRQHDPRTGEPISDTEAFSVSSDGKGSEFLSGLELARKALPAKANLLDIPMAVMQDDRWCAPWVDCKSKLYEVHFCVDGRGYVVNKLGESRCFESHAALAQFLENTKQATFSKGGQTSFGTYGKIEPDIWRASGSFDEVRNDRIEKAQTKALRSLFPVDPARASKPPLYVRPGEMPDNGGRSFCSSVADLLKLGATA